MIKLFDQRGELTNGTTNFAGSPEYQAPPKPLSFAAWHQTQKKADPCPRCSCSLVSHHPDSSNDWIDWCDCCGGICGRPVSVAFRKNEDKEIDQLEEMLFGYPSEQTIPESEYPEHLNPNTVSQTWDAGAEAEWQYQQGMAA